MKIIAAVILSIYFFLIWDDLAIADEFQDFCKVYMKYVEKYPEYMSAGCCEIDHPSNDDLKKGWKGESLLFCDGQEIV